MAEYISELCSLGMRIDDAYVIVNDFFREANIDGLKDYIKEYRDIRIILADCVD